MTYLKLNNLKCKPCNGLTLKLSPEDVSKNLKKLNSWDINNKEEMIFKKFLFKNFKKSLDFVNNVANLADAECHHPDISFGYSYCLIMIHTHAINGLSINDFILASKIDLIG